MVFRFFVGLTVLFSLSFQLPPNASAKTPEACHKAFSYSGGDLRIQVKLYTQCLASAGLNSDNKVAIYNNRGICYYNLRQYNSALADYDKAAQLNPEDAEIYFNKGRTYKKLDQLGRAIASYDKAIELNPKHAAAYNNLAFLLATAKEKKYFDGGKAVRLALKAVSLRNNNPSYRDTLAAAYARLGRFNEAIQAQSKAVLMLQSQGDMAAVKEYRKALVSYERGKKYY